MRNEKRAEEIRAEVRKLQQELRAIRGESIMQLKNRGVLKYPGIVGGFNGKPVDVYESTLNVETLSNPIRKVLTPCKGVRKDGHAETTAKKIKDLTKEEYQAVCACVDEVLAVIDRHNKKLHPEGVAVGSYDETKGLYR